MKLEEWPDDDWWYILYPRDETYQLKPQVLDRHADGKDYREVERDVGENSITYNVPVDAGTDDVEACEMSASSISSDIFPELQVRSRGEVI